MRSNALQSSTQNMYYYGSGINTHSHKSATLHQLRNGAKVIELEPNRRAPSIIIMVNVVCLVFM